MDDEWTINGKNSTKVTRINVENQRVTIADVGRENPSLSAQSPVSRKIYRTFSFVFLSSSLFLAQRKSTGDVFFVS